MTIYQQQLKQKIHLLISLFGYLICGVIGMVYIQNHHPITLLWLVCGLLMANVFYALGRLRYRLLFALFNVMIFVFLVSRPLIDYFRQGYLDTYEMEIYRFTFWLLSVGLGMLLVGTIIGEFCVKEKDQPIHKMTSLWTVAALQKFSCWGYYVTYPFYTMRLVERWMYRRQTTYYDYYATFQSRLPYITYILSAFMFYFLCMYLATKPKKIAAVIALSLYVFANAIHLLIGTRNPVILSILFSIVYFYIRNQEQPGKWIGKFEKLALMITAPIGMLGLAVLNYLRDGQSVKGMNVSELLMDLLYKQGTSFGVLANGYKYYQSLPVRPDRNYTFGPIIDYFWRGSFGNHLFGTEPFTTTTNSLELALTSNSYSHALSYLVKGDEYLAGHGVGSSYLMELWTDFGMWGVAVASVLLGVFMIRLMSVAYSGRVMAFSLQLVIVSTLFFMPRSSVSESFFYLMTMQFWFLVGATWVISLLTARPLSERYHFPSNKNKEGII